MLYKISQLYDLIVVNKQKALVAFLVAGVASYCAQYGINIETLTIKEGLEVVGYGLIAYVSVYLKANNK